MNIDDQRKGAPTLFIASSVERLELARAVQQELEHDANTTVWNQGVFGISKPSIEALIQALPSFDFGVFIFSPDDVTTMRSRQKQTVRDNVIFELGLFVGGLGIERSFFVIPRGVADLQLPTDLLGITPGTFDPRREDNLRAALGPACTDVRNKIKQLGARRSVAQQSHRRRRRVAARA